MPREFEAAQEVRHSLHAMLRYTDPRKDEQQRGMSIKACPISLVLPGHVNSSDELTAILRLVGPHQEHARGWEGVQDAVGAIVGG